MQIVRQEWRFRPGDLKGAMAARREFARYLRVKTSDDDDWNAANLIFGELVANAVKCARSSISVELLENEWSTLRVIDDGDCFDQCVIGPQPLDAESGRGLYIVNQLARRLEITKGHRRCEVTAVLPIHS
jgi:anti-sigma regulatory factor (Ser/Thr protein kinase)